MNDQSQISISIEKSIKNIGKNNWNKCANHDSLNYNPFVSFEFLNALEESKSVNGNSGWHTSYFVAKDKAAVLDVKGTGITTSTDLSLNLSCHLLKKKPNS